MNRITPAAGALALALVALALAAASASAAPVARGAVVGGEPVRPGSHPFIVALDVGCGATLIAPDRVLTAAHCVEGLRVSDLGLYVGARRRQAGTRRYDGRRVAAADVASHPRYAYLGGGAPVNDVAVIRLAEPVTDVAPVRLAAAGERRRTAAGRRTRVVGWGATGTRRRAGLSRVLRMGALRVLGTRSCGRAYGRRGGRRGVFRSGVMVCARSADRRRRPATSPCVGDSGGPLLSGATQVGIVSFGIACGARREPTVFARVAGLRGFIDDLTPTYAPQPLGRPVVEGEAAPDRVVTCRPPEFRHAVDRSVVRWGIDGRLVAVTGGTFRVPDEAAGRELGCRVVAGNRGGFTATERSASVRVAG